MGKLTSMEEFEGFNSGCQRYCFTVSEVFPAIINQILLMLSEDMFKQVRL